jgi:hypothetical protein
MSRRFINGHYLLNPYNVLNGTPTKWLYIIFIFNLPIFKYDNKTEANNKIFLF